MKKRILALLFAGVLAVSCLAGCAGNAGADKKAETTTSAEAADSEWYKEVLDDADMTVQYPYYKVIDVNKDGNPVLIMSTTDKAFVGAEDKACLLANSEEGPKVVKEIGEAAGESFYYCEDQKTLSYYSRSSGETHLEVCEVNNDELAVIKTGDYYASHHAPDVDNEEAVYRLDGEDVSEEELTEVWDTYAKDEFAVTYDAIK